LRVRRPPLPDRVSTSPSPSLSYRLPCAPGKRHSEAKPIIARQFLSERRWGILRPWDRMDHESHSEVTVLLRQWRAGDPLALDRLTPLIYAELHRRAHHYMKNERPGHTLQTTALANEAWMKLIDASSVDWKDRAHFFAI